ncbi:MAG TPA: LysE family translocator [Roseomonas sp.]|nr:LysE family translocator [Roseomonas sp.]
MVDLPVFIGALAVAYLLPGPDMILLLQTGTADGRRHALAVAAGLAMARGTHVVLAALGLGALLRTAPLAFDLVRFIGAPYLVWLGIAILRAPSLLPEGGRRPEGKAPSSFGVAIRRGLLTNLLNPKPLLFCSVLLPQFIRPAQGSVPEQFMLLGVILVGVGLAFDAAFALAGTALGRWLRCHPRLQRLQKWGFAALLIGFGLRLAFAPQPA